MSSFVFYRFKSQKEPSRISFDGTGISVWDLKKEIIMENKMGKGMDFDFAIYNADTEEEYTEDHYIVPRSTSVLARRLPPSRPGRGNAQNYMPSMDGGAAPAGRPSYQSGGGGGGGGSGGAGSRGGPGGSGGWTAGSFSKRFDGKEDTKPASQEPVQVVLPAAAPQDEAGALAAMFAASSQQWQQTQEQMAAATPIHRAPLARPARPAPPPRDPNAPAAGPSTGGAPSGERQPFRHSQPLGDSKPPPLGYICYRCGQKGHWIQECPTNADRAYDDRPRIKRTTGIPKSFLTTVEGPGGTATDATPGSSGVMVTAEGGFVVARPDNASWLAHRALTKNLSATDIQNLAPTDPDLTCPICSKLLRDATLTPCCSTSFCEDCVTNALMDNDMLCPECETRVKSLEKLKEDEGRRERVKTYIAEMVELSKEEKEEEVKEEDGVKTEEGADAATSEIKVETEELFPVIKEEEEQDVKPTLAVPRASLSPVANRSASVVPSDSGRASSATPVPAPAPAASPTPSAPMNAAQQAQMIRQQQLRAQMAMAQQQQMMSMGMNPQMMQQQMMQLQMGLQNPQLPTPMRMQMMQQLQQLQMMMMQMQQNGGFQRAQVQQNGFGGAGVPPRAPTGPAAATKIGGPIPTGPKAANGAGSPTGAGNGAAGAKRAMPAEFGANGHSVKKAA